MPLPAPSEKQARLIWLALTGLAIAALAGLVVAMGLTIIPFPGAIVTCGSALLIALVTFGDWQHPLLVLARYVWKKRET